MGMEGVSDMAAAMPWASAAVTCGEKGQGIHPPTDSVDVHSFNCLKPTGVT